jgi:DNA-binding transcriptional MocR family regulator
MDLGSAVLEQLVTARLLRDRAVHWGAHRERLRLQRDVLAAAVTERLPGWRFRLPRGGLSLWCELPEHDRAGALDLAAEAERRDVAVSPGPAFSLDGGLDRFVRVPFSRPEDELHLAVDRLAEAWRAVTTAPAARAGRRSRVMVA